MADLFHLAIIFPSYCKLYGFVSFLLYVLHDVGPVPNIWNYNTRSFLASWFFQSFYSLFNLASIIL